MTYETHKPIKGYRKVWPETPWCPICGKNNVVLPGSHRPLYIPGRNIEGGERVCVYVCNTCYSKFHTLNFSYFYEYKEWYKCHLEFETHLRHLQKAPS